jgi:NAD+ kinase
MDRMPTRFRHAALVGKYQAQGIGELMQSIAAFLVGQGVRVSLDERTAASTGLTQYGALTLAEIGAQCDLAVVVGGDGTMLGIARQLARYGLPLVGINQGRLRCSTATTRSSTAPCWKAACSVRARPSSKPSP